ncbi:MAPEG family protein [Luteimonas sp. SX5]|uniref:MAPEG family protein n=1 Tax=Luteimonas galliterrae TaxID=2940486 RepID=A0ABT0MMU0_9GAMM|nr:MAPEG family protein [Luteimonas galliterrae]MCL1635923.1 MAPEG family protein [Luteimonas galliterrae]
MTIPYLCILIAALLPYLWVSISKASGQRYDNRDPRGWLAKQDNPRAHRANSAQLNAFEAFAPFAAAVLMAQAVGIDPIMISALSLVFIATRIVHGFLYLANLAVWRSLVWGVGFVSVLALMVLAIMRVGG